MKRVVVLALLSIPTIALAAPAPLAPAERTAIFRAAGFKQLAGAWTRCPDDQSASRMAGSIELEDLNGDGAPEAWVTESSSFCYGAVEQAFVLLTKRAGAWTPILDTPGAYLTRQTRTGGWKDVEVGGPGPGPFPVYRFNGTRYLARP
jgi:hypothetical protein